MLHRLCDIVDGDDYQGYTSGIVIATNQGMSRADLKTDVRTDARKSGTDARTDCIWNRIGRIPRF